MQTTETYEIRVHGFKVPSSSKNIEHSDKVNVFSNIGNLKKKKKNGQKQILVNLLLLDPNTWIKFINVFGTLPPFTSSGNVCVAWFVPFISFILIAV